MSEELKLAPCPFCGAAPRLAKRNSAGGARVVCADGWCDVAGPYRKDRTEAAEAWNRRAIDPDVEALVKAGQKSIAVMRECGWQLAVCAEPAGDGVLQAAATECHDDLRAALAPFTEKETK